MRKNERYDSFNNEDNNYRLRRERDERIENNMKFHLDQLYAENGLEIVRNEQAVLQRKGVDLIQKKGSTEYYCDEKSASTYFNTHLETFSFELFTCNNKDFLGWFDIDNDYLLTQYYYIIYPYAPGNKDELKTLDELEVIIVSKEKMWQHLKSLGFSTVKDIICKFNENSEYVLDGKEKRVWRINSDLKVVHSLHIKPEEPMNILFSRKLLKKLAEKVLFKKY